MGDCLTDAFTLSGESGAPTICGSNGGYHSKLCAIWHFLLWSFQGRDTKLERFLAKNQLYSNEITKF